MTNQTSVFIANIQALGNELQKAMDVTTPETYPAERDKVLEKFGMVDQLSHLTHG